MHLMAVPSSDGTTIGCLQRRCRVMYFMHPWQQADMDACTVVHAVAATLLQACTLVAVQQHRYSRPEGLLYQCCWIATSSSYRMYHLVEMVHPVAVLMAVVLL